MCRTMTTLMAQRGNVIQSRVGEKETIHSGHFMVSHFEADAQDDEYEVAVPVPEVSSKKLEIIPFRSVIYQHAGDRVPVSSSPKIMSVSIETSLTKLFQCMSIAYRQKLTSPKWNRFKGVRLRWKEKIRLNNVIWRCWHMQFVEKRNIGVCQFASPLDVDVHSKPEAVVLEGKYWKRKLSAVTAEYKRWRIFYQKFAYSPAREQCEALTGMIDWNSGIANNDGNMMIDEDYMDFMSDTLFSTITSNQPFAFPDTREIARGASLADFIQPSLVQLQPNLDDYMDMLEPLQDLLSPSTKLPSVPEEYHPSDDLYRSLNVNYEDVSSSSYYTQSTSSVMDSASGISSNTDNASSKMYVKLEQDQPLQLSVSQELSQKGSYRSGNNLYQESNTTSLYPNQSNGTSYSAYPTQNYHQQSTQSSQHSVQDSMIVNYSHQLSNKNAPTVQSPVNYNTSPSLAGSHYSSYESTSCYSSSTGNVQPYSPSTSSNYKILPSTRSARSGSLPMNPEEELFVVPNKLAQRGRSRSGSSLISSQGRYLPHDQCASDPATNCALLTQLLTTSRHYGYHGSYQQTSCGGGSSPSPYNGNTVHDTRTCCTVNGHRPVAHCTALLGRRSRTPDHILCSNSNPVGYCKPRTPIVSSQSCNEGSLINLSQHQRGASSSDKSYKTRDSSNPPYPYPLRQSPCGSKTSYEKYPSSTLFQSSSWTPSSGYHSINAASSLPSSGSPFVFGTQHTNVDTSNLPQIMNNTSTSSSPKHPSSPSTSESLSLSPLTVSSPVRTTPSSPTTKSSSSVTPYKEHRRVCHINAEQKRRCNIKNGFDTLHQLIPHLAQNPNTKMSKAAMLQKGAEYIRTLRGERSQLRDEIESLKQQVESLNSAISNCQSLLPATGAPISRHKADKMKEMFDEYVRERTKQNWKFWILSLIFEPLLSSFNSSVSNTSIEELFRTTIQWAEQYCSLVDLRPIVLNALRHVCTKTEVLSNPNKLPDEAREVVLSSSRNADRN